MSESKDQEKSEKTVPNVQKNEVTPQKCLLGAAMAGILGTGMYYLTYAIGTTFANKPITSSNQLVINISSAVRTLVVGVASLATFIFAFVSFGLVLLAIQLTLQGIKGRLKSSSDR
ncbi:hypothetical protein PCC7424_4465 [Gloeothece citriformis PCC 7424]|uniref:DUF3082 domain-containing protein n=1 Tax=Gloeothece citriformis (strain PCC 7424) TaxID=65393 RepID=B7K960_GLOC7|nr:DUF3082 domain-containing protein [Gloeothece citriformis]ACK72829.1 hypothetical protein PCC7424_4465 [Gloeothece citriformis PCC 7424]